MHTYVKRDYQASQIFVKNCFTSNYSKVLNVCQSFCLSVSVDMLRRIAWISWSVNVGACGGPDSGASLASFPGWLVGAGSCGWWVVDSGEGAVDTTVVVAPGGGAAMVGCSQRDPTDTAQKLLSLRFFSRQAKMVLRKQIYYLKCTINKFTANDKQSRKMWQYMIIIV